MEIEKEIKQDKFKSEYHKLILNILVTNNWLNEKIIARLKAFNLTPKQFNVLRILRGQQSEPIKVNEIRQRMIDKMSDVSRIVERLRLKGLVKRETCENNRRAVDVVITRRGLSLLKKIDALDEEWERNFSNLSKQQAAQLNHLLNTLRS